MNRLKRLAGLTALTLALSLGVPAGAASLTILPSSTLVTPGGAFAVDLVVSGLGDAAAPSVGAFDIDIGFDPTDLTLIGVTLGTALGDVGLGEALDASFGHYLPGVINIAEVSFLAPATLDAAQPDSFVLATLAFAATGMAAGDTTTLGILTVLSLGDALGDPLTADALTGATVTAIPVPAAVWLFAGALAALAGRGRGLRRP